MLKVKYVKLKEASSSMFDFKGTVRSVCTVCVWGIGGVGGSVEEPKSFCYTVL